MRLAEHLANKQLLLLLDNCEHLMPDVAELADFLLRSAPSLRILATSRQPLGVDGETVVIVPPLSVPGHDEPIPPSATSRYDAVTLFVERATAAHPSFELTDANCSAVLKVCRDLDGLPLAIELVAGRLRSLSVEQLLDRLDDRFRLLSMGNRAARSRQRTLRALVTGALSCARSVSTTFSGYR